MCLINNQATLIRLVPSDTSKDTACVRLQQEVPFPNLLPGFPVGCVSAPRTSSTSAALQGPLCLVSWLALMGHSYSGLQGWKSTKHLSLEALLSVLTSSSQTPREIQNHTCVLWLKSCSQLLGFSLLLVVASRTAQNQERYHLRKNSF